MALLIKTPALSMRSLSVVSDNLDSETKSCQFLKTILPWAISSVLNRRCIFDEKYLKHRQIHNVPYVGFKSEMPKEHCAYKIFKSSDLFRKLILEKHLKEIFVAIEDKENEKMLEEFVFVFKYLGSDDDITLSDNRNCPISIQLAKFHTKINHISDKIKYSEAKIRIQFSCRLNEGVPRSIINKNLKAMKDKQVANTRNLHVLANLKTDFHLLELFISEQPAPTSRTQEMATTQTQTQTSNNSISLPDYLSGMSPTSCEIQMFHTANSGSGEMVVNSEEFVPYSEQLDNDLILKPIRFNTPKPKTEIIKNLLIKRKLAKGFEPVNTLGKNRAKKLKIESSGSSTFDYSSD